MKKSTGKGRRGRKREDYEGHQATLRSDKRVHCLDLGEGFCGCVLMSNCSNSAAYNMSIVSQKNCKKNLCPFDNSFKGEYKKHMFVCNKGKLK